MAATVSPPVTVVAPARLSFTVGLKLPTVQLPPLATADPSPQVDACAAPADSAANAAPAIAARSGASRIASRLARRLVADVPTDVLPERLPRARAVSATATQQPAASLHIDRNE